MIKNFDRAEWIVPVLNILMFIRILTVYPLLCYFLRLILLNRIDFRTFIRIQNSLVFFGSEWPGYFPIILKNVIIVAVGCLSSMYYDKVNYFLFRGILYSTGNCENYKLCI